MEKKLIAVACTAIVVGVFLLWFIVLPALPIVTTISQIVSNPEAWVNKKVRVEGEIIGDFLSFPIHILLQPYNYVLRDKDNRTISIGVSYSGEVQDTPANVAVIGVVEVGATKGIVNGAPAVASWVYFIAAERIVILE